ncbi:MAG: molybdopterin molybdotransferase MoeA [Dehalococcoidia bacterium]|nr:molybdopterin molybdotransferase MoeA [Dehalococcoidia bacterium]
MTAHTHHDDHVHADEDDMISIEEALERVLSYTSVLPGESRPLLESLGGVLAEDIIAGFDIPPLPNSGMDGYAVHADDVAGATEATPIELPVLGEVAAGAVPSAPLAPGGAIRIMTGAPVPAGSGAVVPFEDTDEMERRSAGDDLKKINVRRAPRPGANIRLAGEDIGAGSKVLSRGMTLRPCDIGLAASLGLTHLPLIRKPVVAIISTGDEIMEPGEERRPGAIYNSNAYTIASFVARHGGTPRIIGTARDTEASLNEMLDRAMEADLVLTSAGVSRGDYDVVKDVLASRGHIVNRSVRIKPARPLAFGALKTADGRDIPHIGLPGNPVAVVVAFEVFARPAILAMAGHTSLEKPVVEAVLEDPIRNPDHRRVFARVEVYIDRETGDYRARLSGSQGSGVLTAAAAANGLAICPEDSDGLKPGDVATVQMLDWSEQML